MRRIGTPTHIEGAPGLERRKAARRKRQEKYWASRSGPVRVITADDLPADSKLIQGA